ncbi:MAG: DUF4276 family protein [Rectinemataceae bacterium]
MSRATRLIFLLEEESMEAFLRAALPGILPASMSYEAHPFRGKGDLLRKLKPRLKAYRSWLPEDHRIFVLVDRDNEDCRSLKELIDAMAAEADFPTHRGASSGAWRLASCIAIEELEAWYFGDWEGARRAYPRLPATIPEQAPYRWPDEIRGGTWEAFERIARKAGYFSGGLRKIEAARAIGTHIDARRNRSESFRHFIAAIEDARA